MSAPNFASGTIWTEDNVKVLRGMNSECIDLIYLDPPFNSNREYAAPVGSKAAGAHFKDAWTLDDVDEAWVGEVADTAPAVAALLQSTGIIHGKSMQSYLTYMAVRLLEMRRVLKPTGSIYLHCDQTANHYLKLLVDAVFGRSCFRGDITWQRTFAHGDSQSFGNVSDRLLFYGAPINSNAVRVPLAETGMQRYTHTDERGVYKVTTLKNHSLRGGGYSYEFHGHIALWLYPEASMRKLESEDRIHLPKKTNGVPQLKLYLHENKGQVPSNLWLDIKMPRRERTGYPTQKPLALLERIIKASSKEGDVVLDPFCGTATTCVAAEKLGRRWVGIDLSAKAIELANERLRDTMGELCHLFVTARTDILHRTDTEKPPHFRTQKHFLYGKQEGKCEGCRLHFPFKNLTIDHIVSRHHGGGNHIENLQLLCGHCNSIKKEHSMAYLLSRLKELGIR